MRSRTVTSALAGVLANQINGRHKDRHIGINDYGSMAFATWSNATVSERPCKLKLLALFLQWQDIMLTLGRRTDLNRGGLITTA